MSIFDVYFANVIDKYKYIRIDILFLVPKLKLRVRCPELRWLFPNYFVLFTKKNSLGDDYHPFTSWNS